MNLSIHEQIVYYYGRGVEKLYTKADEMSHRLLGREITAAAKTGFGEMRKVATKRTWLATGLAASVMDLMNSRQVQDLDSINMRDWYIACRGIQPNFYDYALTAGLCLWMGASAFTYYKEQTLYMFIKDNSPPEDMKEKHALLEKMREHLMRCCDFYRPLNEISISNIRGSCLAATMIVLAYLEFLYQTDPEIPDESKASPASLDSIVILLMGLIIDPMMLELFCRFVDFVYFLSHKVKNVKLD